MMKIIDKYIAKEVAGTFVAVLLVLTVILSLGKVAQSVELVLGKGAEIVDILKLMALLLPSSLQFTVPIALLVAVLSSMGRISGDNELTILKSSGLSLLRISLPIMAVTVLVVLISLLTTFFIIPKSNLETKRLLFEMLKKQAALGVEEGRFTDSFTGALIYVSKIKPRTGEIENIFISDTKMAKEPIVVVAKRAVLTGDDEKMKVMLHLFDGSLHMTNADLSHYRRIDFASYTVGLDVGKVMGNSEKSSTEMTFGELWQKIDQTPNGDARREMLIELNKKITIPLSCLGFCLIALPLGITSQRAARSRGFVLGFALALIYFLFSTGGEALAETGKISPAIATWLPLAVFGAVGGTLYHLAARELLVTSLVFPPRMFKRSQG